MMGTIAQSPSLDRQATDSTDANCGIDLLDASERYLSGKMTADDFDALTTRHVAEYRQALTALAESRYPSSRRRFMGAASVSMRQIIVRLKSLKAKGAA